jgi:predicted aspartyl protease
MWPLLAVFLGLPSVAYAQDCSLQLVNRVQLIRDSSGVDLIPVSINGVQKNFVFDTGGGWTSISKDLAVELHLPTEPGGLELHDMYGNISSDRTRIREFQVGRLRDQNAYLSVLSRLPENGIYAPDHMLLYDIDVDFGTDRLNYFSQNHCPGKVLYWKADAMAEVPIDKGRFGDNKLVVPVTLDGHDFDAVIDTGASNSVLRSDIARQMFGLTPGDTDTPLRGIANGDSNLPVYSHRFQSLTFEGVAVSNATLEIVSDAMGQKADQFKGPIHAPQLILGMDVLRKLHIYFAFKEGKMYVTPASVPSETPPVQATSPQAVSDP